MNHARTASLQRGDILLRTVFKAAGDWVWSPEAYTYRNTATGRFMSAETQLELRNAVVARQREEFRKISEAVASGKVTPAEFERAMQKEIKNSYVSEYAFGRGGKAQLTDADRARLGTNIGQQYDYLAGFRADIEGGELTAEGISRRAELYASSSTHAFEAGKTAARGMPELDQYPGDGQTACLVNCLCSLEIEDTETGWNVRWVLGSPATEHCEDCPGLAADWSPLFVERE